MNAMRPYGVSALMAMLLITISGCAGGLVGSKEEKLAYFDSLEKDTLARLVKEQPKTEQELAQSVGYAVIEKRVVKVPVVGAGGGAGVVADKASGKKSYLRGPELQFGAGWGGRAEKVILIFQDVERLRDPADGTWKAGIKAEAAAKAGDVGKRRLNPNTGWKFLQGSGVHRGHLVGGCIEVFDWTRGTEIFADNWQDAILFLETSEDAPPPEYVARSLRVFAAMGILPRLSGILFGRPGGNVPPEKFEEYDRAILQVVKEEEGLDELPIITHMDFGHTSPMFVLPYGVQAELDMDHQRFSILENTVTD